MTNIVEQVAALDWTSIGEYLDAHGHAHLRGVFPMELAATLTRPQQPDARSQHASGIAPATPGGQLSFLNAAPHPDEQPHRLVEVQRLPEPLPEPLQQLSAALYAHLHPIAERWEPAIRNHNDYQHPLAILQRIHAGGHQDLQQMDAATTAFPLAIAATLNAAGPDFRGGEWMLVEQRPRMQSRAMVVQPQLGDVLIFSTGHRPLRSASGYTRAQMKHGISRVHSGVRVGLQLYFTRAAAP